MSLLAAKVTETDDRPPMALRREQIHRWLAPFRSLVTPIVILVPLSKGASLDKIPGQGLCTLQGGLCQDVGKVMRTNSTAVSASVRAAISTLFESFKTRPRPQTAWARKVLAAKNPSDEFIACEIKVALAIYCPNVPKEYVPFLIELLSAAIRLARRDETSVLED